MRERIMRVKQAPKSEDPFDREVLEAIAVKVDTLRRKYCRLAACFIVFKNAKKKGTIRDATELGARIATEEVRANPMRYIVMFILAIVASIYLGVWVSATIFDLVHPATAGTGVASPVPTNGAAATRWVYYGLATFGAPIAVCLMLRYLTWSYDAEQPNSYPASYASIVGVALCVSVASLALATRLGHGVHAHDQWTDLLYRDFKWGWSPALICVYVVYHIDRQIDPLLPDIGKLGGEGVSHRVLACFSFAILVTLLSALPTASLEVQPELAVVHRKTAVRGDRNNVCARLCDGSRQSVLPRQTQTQGQQGHRSYESCASRAVKRMSLGKMALEAGLAGPRRREEGFKQFFKPSRANGIG